MARTGENIYKRKDGRWEAVKAGITTITVTCGEKTRVHKIRVYIPVKSIKLNQAAVTIKPGGRFTLEATLNKDATFQRAYFTSADTKIATVSTTGKGLTTVITVPKNAKKGSTVRIEIKSWDLRKKAYLTVTVG